MNIATVRFNRLMPLTLVTVFLMSTALLAVASSPTKEIKKPAKETPEEILVNPLALSCVDVTYAGDDLDVNGVPLCGRKVSLTNSAMDTLGSCPGDINWNVRLDIWSDGTVDWIFTSGPEANLSNTDNILPLPANPTASFIIPEFIHNSCYDHTVIWTVNDNCNNEASCTQLFQVEDKTAPTPNIVGISSLSFHNGSAEGWASEYDLGSFDDCTPPEHLLYSFSATQYIPNRTFTCIDATNEGLIYTQIWVWDNACIPNVSPADLILTSGCTSHGTVRIGGAFRTETGETVENVEAEVSSPNMISPNDMLTDSTGLYAFDNLVSGFDFEVVGEKNDDYRNGVSTLDLVLIQKHILQTRPLDSPYKMIAADINNSQSITVSDLIGLRKLILGIYAELPSNDSWRFIDGAQTLTISDPWIFTEAINLNNVQESHLVEDFVAVKIGDVNGSVQANATSVTTESRSSDALLLEVMEAELKAGETTTIEVLSSNFTEVYGCQFTMNFNGLIVNDVEGASLELTDANVSLHENRMTMSYHSSASTTASTDEVLFTINVTAIASGKLSTMININSAVTRAEAYFGNDLNVGGLELGLRGDASITAVAENILYQNEPNPFKGETIISFSMMEAAQAIIRVYDIAGKLVHSISNEYPIGFSKVILQKSDLGSTSGVLYYQLESGDFIATKKMIVVE